MDGSRVSIGGRYQFWRGSRCVRHLRVEVSKWVFGTFGPGTGEGYREVRSRWTGGVGDGRQGKGGSRDWLR